jgi:predicted DsbA family dithiol-disulfide isomerase
MAIVNPSALVTITSDLVCPWCWVGLRKLQAASELAKIDVNIVWKPFLLRPNTPQEGIPKDGTPTSRAPQRLKDAGKLVGIDFTGLTDRTPNTIDFHAIMKYLLDSKINQTPFQEACFDGYFTKGIFPDHKGMMEHANQVGVADHVKALFESQDVLQEYRQLVTKEASDASRRGVSGVPSFAFDGETEVFSGAQDVEIFVKFLKQHATTDTTTTA